MLFMDFGLMELHEHIMSLCEFLDCPIHYKNCTLVQIGQKNACVGLTLYSLILVDRHPRLWTMGLACWGLCPKKKKKYYLNHSKIHAFTVSQFWFLYCCCSSQLKQCLSTWINCLRYLVQSYFLVAKSWRTIPSHPYMVL